MDQKTAHAIVEGRRMAASDEELIEAVKETAPGLIAEGDPLALLVEHELELRPAAGIGWECGYFSYDGGEDQVLGKGTTPAEAIRAAAVSL